MKYLALGLQWLIKIILMVFIGSKEIVIGYSVDKILQHHPYTLLLLFIIFFNSIGLGNFMYPQK